VVLGGLAVLGVAACSGTSKQVSDKIADEAKAQLKLDAKPSTSCPSDAKASKGSSFECKVTIDGTDLPVHVEFSDDTHFTFAPMGVAQQRSDVEPALAADVSAQVGDTVTVDCGSHKFIVIPANGSSACTVKGSDGSTAQLKLTIDSDGNLQQELQSS